MKIGKEIGNAILAFFLCLCLVGVFLLGLVSSTLMSKEYLEKQVVENGYYEKIETDLKNGIEEYQYQSGFSSEVFENLYSSEMVKEDVDSIIAYIYDEAEIVNHAEMVEERITQNMNQFLKDNRIVLNEQQQKNVDEFADIIVKVYERKVNAMSSYIAEIAQIRGKVQEILKILQIVLSIILVGLVVAIGLMNWKDLWGGMNTFAVSLLSAGILFFLMKSVIVKNVDIENILLLSQSLSDLGKQIMYDLLSKVHYAGILGIVIGMLLIVMANRQRIKNREN